MHTAPKRTAPGEQTERGADHKQRYTRKRRGIQRRLRPSFSRIGASGIIAPTVNARNEKPPHPRASRIVGLTGSRALAC
jgi:hypothetical protein